MHEMVMHAPVTLKSLYQILINVDNTIDPHCESVLTNFAKCPEHRNEVQHSHIE